MKRFFIILVLVGSICGLLQAAGCSKEKSNGLIECLPGTKVGLFSHAETEICGSTHTKLLHFKALPNHIAVNYICKKNSHHPLEGNENFSVLIVNGRELDCYYHDFETIDGRSVYRFFFQDDRNSERIYVAVIDKANLNSSAVAVLDQYL